jgi:hypothetical protein
MAWTLTDQLAKDEQEAKDRQKAIDDNLPSWSQVETALDNISNLAEAKAALKKIAKVVYWMAKNKGE